MNELLASPMQAYRAWCRLWKEIKPQIEAGQRFEVSVRPERRNLDQNALLHAILGEISRAVEWAGKKRDIEVWKRLLVAAWLRARGESIEVLPAIDGHGVDLVYAPTSKLTKQQFAELVDYVQCWAAEQGVEIAEAA